jgi:hypothetical protein
VSVVADVTKVGAWLNSSTGHGPQLVAMRNVAVEPVGCCGAALWPTRSGSSGQEPGEGARCTCRWLNGHLVPGGVGWHHSEKLFSDTVFPHGFDRSHPILGGVFVVWRAGRCFGMGAMRGGACSRTVLLFSDVPCEAVE